MLKSTLRDEIRALAEIPGATTMTGLINAAIQDTIDSLTSLAKYDELFTPNHPLAIAANGIATIPSDFQHLDETEIYYLIDGDTESGHKIRLNKFQRIRSTTIGPARQWRLFSTQAGDVITRKLEISPSVDIDTANDVLWINYWRRLIWSNEATQLPIPRFAEYIKLRVAARVAKKENTRLSTKLNAEAKMAYAALRAGVY
jgi:hypothetical protein